VCLTEDRQRPVAATVKAKASADGPLTWPGRCIPLVPICVVWLCVVQMLATARVDVLVLLRKLRPRGVYLSPHLFGSCLQSALSMVVAEPIFSRPVSGPILLLGVFLVFKPGGCPRLIHSPFPFVFYVWCARYGFGHAP
jgi:hypothetical protein